ncbi:hypothetical protein J6590_018359 [Homalodisca vitripennis]|nr:hypothetical protein J6590_018359 [Homalodisca vitripennis]
MWADKHSGVATLGAEVGGVTPSKVKSNLKNHELARYFARTCVSYMNACILLPHMFDISRPPVNVNKHRVAHCSYERQGCERRTAKEFLLRANLGSRKPWRGSACCVALPVAGSRQYDKTGATRKNRKFAYAVISDILQYKSDLFKRNQYIQGVL